MKTVTITNVRGQEISLPSKIEDTSGTRLVSEYTGFTQDFSVSMSTQRYPYQQGASIVGMSAAGRKLSLTLHIFEDNQEDVDQYIREILSKCSPYMGELTITHSDGNRASQITGYYSKHKVTDSTNVVGYKILQLNFQCEKGLFEDVDVTSNAYNSGDYLAPLYLTINGDCLDPVIEWSNSLSGDSESITLEYDLTDGRYIEINTEIGKEYIYVYESDGSFVEDILYTLTQTSNLFQMGMGSNLITISATTGTPTVSYEYHNQYISA